MGRSRGVTCLLLLWITAITHQQEICRRTIDLVFVIDGSNSLGQDNFDFEISTIASAVDNLTISTDDARVGAVLFGTVVDAVLDLQTNATKFKEELRLFDYPDAATFTNLAIAEGIKLLTRQPRVSVPKVMMIVTDGASSNPNETAYQAAFARSQGIEIWGVGIRLDVEKELASLTTGGNRIIKIDEFSEKFVEQMRNLTTIICFQAEVLSTYTIPTTTTSATTTTTETTTTATSATTTTTTPTITTTPTTTTPTPTTTTTTPTTTTTTPTTTTTTTTTTTPTTTTTTPTTTTTTTTTTTPTTTTPTTTTTTPTTTTTTPTTTTTRPTTTTTTPTTTTTTRPTTTTTTPTTTLTRPTTATTTPTTTTTRQTTTTTTPTTTTTTPTTTTTTPTTTTTTPTTTTSTTTTPTTTTTTPTTTTPTTTTTTTATTTPASTTTKLTTTSRVPAVPPSVDPCEKSPIIGGVGHAPYPDDCGKVMQCYYNPLTNKTLVVVRRCPLGQFWDQVSLQCAPSWKVKCPFDRCQADCDLDPVWDNSLAYERGEVTYAMGGNRRGYFVCHRGKAYPKCCPRNFNYVTGVGCQLSFGDCEKCGPEETCNNGLVVCDKAPVWDNPRSYDEFTSQQGQRPTTSCFYANFSIAECRCQVKAFDALMHRREDCGPYHEVNSSLTCSNTTVGLPLKRWSRHSPLTLKFWANLTTPDFHFVLSPESACTRDTAIKVRGDGEEITAMVTDKTGQKAWATVLMRNATGQVEIILMFHDGLLTLGVTQGNSQTVTTVKAPLENRCLDCLHNLRVSFSEGQVCLLNKIQLFDCKVQVSDIYYNN